MPTSHHHQISKIIEVIISVKPDSVLDIGIGFGKYGVLLREYLELWNNEGHQYNHFTKRIDGIEAFKHYITPIHEYVYDNILIGDALELIDRIEPRYDLV